MDSRMNTHSSSTVSCSLHLRNIGSLCYSVMPAKVSPGLPHSCVSVNPTFTLSLVYVVKMSELNLQVRE
jgi:hypothetical protein